ncbi:MAG TPA: GNAT family N-acetyltransferase [Symbiobacteriaceae bacterium]|nr:GNAT family N-acetyltransferase [Symbiobacteriaceae bacterium]
MTIHIRPFTATDYPALATLLSEQEREPTTAERLADQDARRPPSAIVMRLVAEDETGRMVGYALGSHVLAMPAGQFIARVRVRASHEGQGVGRQLWNAQLSLLRERGATKIETSVKETDRRAHQIALREGFVQTHHLFESTLNLPPWSPEPWLETVRSIESTGIRFTSLAELGMTETWLRRVHQSNQRLEHDVPAYENRGEMPYEEWLTFIKDNPSMPPEGMHIALDGEQIAAMSLAHQQASGALYNTFTGVERAYRGRGLALAMKVRALIWAKSTGAPYIRTNNHSVNGPMLAINQRLGYIPEPGRLILAKSLT